MHRTGWPLLLMVTVITGGLAVRPARTAETAPRPNIVLVLADDLGADELGCYGHPTHRTPRLDRMAAEGLRLSTFYATPLCTTTRMAIMTGQYGFRNGYLGMQLEAFKPAPDSPQRDIGNHFTHGDLLQRAGYVTAQAGKWQLSGKHPTLIHDSGFDEYRMWAYSYNLPEGVEHTGRWEGRPGKSNTARYWHPSLVQNGHYLDTGADDYGPDLIHEFVVDFLSRHREKPRFVYYTSLLTHGPHEPTPDPDRPGAQRPSGFETNLEYLDYLMGRLVDFLEQEKLRDNTLVLFVGDNGTAGRGKGTVTERGARVPFIAWGPRWLKPAAGAERALADLTDVLPTLAELAGQPLPTDRTFDGQSLVPLLRGIKTTHRDWIYSYLNDGRIVRTQNWLLELPGEGKRERFFECGENRNGDAYREISGEPDKEARAARSQIDQILAQIPKPVPRPGVQDRKARNRK